MKRPWLSILIPSLLVAALLVVFLILRNRPVSWRIAGAHEAGAYEQFIEALQRVLSWDGNRIKIQKIASAGSVDNLELLRKREVDLALIQNGLRSEVSVAVVAELYREAVHILLPRDSEITCLAELRGRRLATDLPGSGTQAVAYELLTHYGLTEGADYQTLALAPQDAAQALLAGEADALILVAALRAPIIEALLASGQVRFLSLDHPDTTGGIPHGIHERHPHLQPFLIPRHVYPQSMPAEPVSTLAVSTLLVAQQDLPAQSVRQLTETLFKHRDRLIQLAPDIWHLRELTPDRVFSYPIHAGSDDFYRRKDPAFLLVYADVIALFISAGVGLFGLIATLRRWAQKRRKSRIDTYYGRINTLLQKLEPDTSDIPLLEEHERSLRKIQQEAFQDLIAEKLRPDDSFTILQNLLENGFEEIQFLRDRAR